MVSYWINVKHVKHVLYINELYREKTSFHRLNNQEEVFVFYKIVLEIFGF